MGTERKEQGGTSMLTLSQSLRQSCPLTTLWISTHSEGSQPLLSLPVSPVSISAAFRAFGTSTSRPFLLLPAFLSGSRHPSYLQAPFLPKGFAYHPRPH